MFFAKHTQRRLFHSSPGLLFILAGLTCFAALCALQPARAQENAPPLFVDVRAQGSGTGLSWADACPNLQDAIDAAAQNGQEIWVAGGTYQELITLREGVHVFGGFSGAKGLNETRLEQRDWQKNPTVIDSSFDTSGSLNAHTVSCINVTAARLDGLVVTGGHPLDNPDRGLFVGGGLYINHSIGVEVAHCVIRGNATLGYGAGVYAINSTINLSDCTVRGNRSRFGGGLYLERTAGVFADCQVYGNAAEEGAGLYCVASSPAFSHCVFVANGASDAGTNAKKGLGGLGGGLALLNGSSPALDGCIIAGNDAGQGGGAYLSSTPGNLIAPFFVNCLIAGNTATQAGPRSRAGGLLAGPECSPRLINCTIADNTCSGRGGALLDRAAPGHPVLFNCLLSGNTNYAIVGAYKDAATTLTNCLFYDNPEGDYLDRAIAGGQGGTPLKGAAALNTRSDSSNNIDGDPKLAAGPTGKWTAIGPFNAAEASTTLTDAAANYLPNTLKGQLLNPNTGQRRQTFVLANTAKAITVAGDLTGWVKPGAAYRFMDYHPGPGSALLDAGAGSFGDLTAPKSDLEGKPRPVDLPRTGANGPAAFDIGAYELSQTDWSRPDVIVSLDGQPLPNGGGPVDFGRAPQGGPALTKTFKVSNPGTVPLTTAGLSLPPGYVVTEALAGTIAADGADTLTVKLITPARGAFTGPLRFGTNVPGKNPYTITLKGTVGGQ